MTILDSIILGLVEGITEFLPVSSTAHLILTAKLLGLKETASLKAYETIIQFGAILAVLFIYKDKIFFDIKDKVQRDNKLILWLKLCIGYFILKEEVIKLIREIQFLLNQAIQICLEAILISPQ